MALLDALEQELLKLTTAELEVDEAASDATLASLTSPLSPAQKNRPAGEGRNPCSM